MIIREARDRLNTLLQGKSPEKIDTAEIAAEDQRLLAEALNRLIEFFREMQEFIVPLSKGELHEIKMQPKNFLGSPFKELHSRLLHLTWQAGQVAKGDYGQRIDFMGEFSEAFNAMFVCLEQKEKALRDKIVELEEALSYIKGLEGILPICSRCKKIRIEGADPGDQNGWVSIEQYVGERTHVQFTHGICPECVKVLYPELADKLTKRSL